MHALYILLSKKGAWVMGSETTTNYQKARPYTILIFGLQGAHGGLAEQSLYHLLCVFTFRFLGSNRVPFDGASFPFLLAIFGFYLSADFSMSSLLVSQSSWLHKELLNLLAVCFFFLFKPVSLASQYDL